MSMVPVTVQKPSEFIEKLETEKLDTPANVSSLRDEFQVEIIYFVYLNVYFKSQICD